MTSLKGLLFSQYAAEGLANLVEEMQKKYKPKKGRRFNHNNITYEVSRPVLKENSIEFEISSKIPEDELGDSKDMKAYFKSINKIISKSKPAPVSIEMENIVWDSRRDTEKERDYVKLLYRYALDDLFDNETIINNNEALASGSNSSTPASSTFTRQGTEVLNMVREMIHARGKENLEALVGANDTVQKKLSK
jgi:hypothetical protein